MTTSPLMREMRVIENAILYVMESHQDSMWEGRQNQAYGLAFLARETGLHRDVVRGVCRSLTDQGLAFYMKGLWSQNDMPAGAGYGITDAGAKRLYQALEVAA